MAHKPRPKGANAPIGFAFSNALNFVMDKPNINNIPAHAWNSATHAQIPLATTATTTASASTPSVYTATAVPIVPNSTSPTPSPLLSAGVNTAKNAASTFPTPSGSSLLQSLAAANPLITKQFQGPASPSVLIPAPGDTAAPNTAASSPLSSAPPSPSLLPPSTALTVAATPNAAHAGLVIPCPLPFKPLDGAAGAFGTVTNAALAAPDTISFSPTGRSLDTANFLFDGSSASIVPRFPASNTEWAPAFPSQSSSLAPTTTLGGLQSQELHLNPHYIDPYKIELEFRALAARFPTAFETSVGLYLQDSGRTPSRIGQNVAYSLSCRGWERDTRRKDILNAVPNADVERWVAPKDSLFLAIVAEAGRYTGLFEASMRWFATEHDVSESKMERIIRKAGWTTWTDTVESMPFKIMHTIFIMEEGEEKDRKLAQAKQESPLFFDYCLKDPFCGTISVKKRKRVDLDHQVVISYTPEGCKELILESKPKRLKMSAVRPMQVHNVPLEERAFDSKGNRLPWALEWPEGHPNARGQKRHVEEKGPFGKSNKRKGSSRTRTATPAKKENPTLDSFEKALNYDLKKQAESPTDTTTPSRSQIDAPSVNKVPTQVLLYGYPSSRQWQAIDTYERICGGGIICEDYERQPDVSLRRYPNTLSNAPRAHMTRPLTKAEKALAFQYAGGAHWIKVTFDSAEAAERAIESSPVQIQQHWAYAQPYYDGITPQLDAPIAMTSEERAAGRPLVKHSQIYGPSSAQQAGALPRTPFTTSQNSILNTSTPNLTDQQHEDVSLTSSTASSGTATGPENSTLRHRGTTQASHPGQAQQPIPQMMRFFPDTPRTILRPAHEALLPQPTFWERQFRWLADHGLMPGEVIGNGVPLLDNGQIDWARASFYWKFFFWVDFTFGTDYCGLRNDD